MTGDLFKERPVLPGGLVEWYRNYKRAKAKAASQMTPEQIARIRMDGDVDMIIEGIGDAIKDQFELEREIEE